MIEYVKMEDLQEVWPTVEPLLAPALQGRAGFELSSSDVFWAISEKAAALYIAVEGGVLQGAAVVEYIKNPKLLSANVIALGGRGMHRYAGEFRDALRSAGVGRVTGCCHPSAARWCRRMLRWRERYVVMAEDL